MWNRRIADEHSRDMFEKMESPEKVLEKKGRRMRGASIAVRGQTWRARKNSR